MTLESKPAPMRMLCLGGIAGGSLLMYAARGFSTARANELAGFLLGSLILGLSLLALVVGESRRVELDEEGRRVLLDVIRRWGGRKRIEIPFADIEAIDLGAQGKPSAGTRYYDLIVRRRDGREVYLFGGCVFEGRMSREWIEGLRNRFLQAL